MSEGDRELFLLLCVGLLESYCSQVDFESQRFGVTAAQLPARGSGPRIVLEFTEADFQQAILVTEEWASSLWPDRPPRHRAVQLMGVHADEGIATVPGEPNTYVMTLPDGHVVIRPSREEPIATVAAAVEAADKERKRLRHVVEEGLADGHTFEWR